MSKTNCGHYYHLAIWFLPITFTSRYIIQLILDLRRKVQKILPFPDYFFFIHWYLVNYKIRTVVFLFFVKRF
jgi:hypothetical protein